MTYADCWKINNVIEDQWEKLIQTSIFSKLSSAHEVLRRKNKVHIKEHFLHQGTLHEVDISLPIDERKTEMYNSAIPENVQKRGFGDIIL